MSTTHVPTSPRARLRELAGLLFAIADDDPELLPFAVGVESDGDALQLATRPLLGGHPADALLGFVAPSHWCAFGVVATGLAHHLPSADTPPAPPEQPPSPLRVVHLQPRRGRALALLDLDGAGPTEVRGPGAAGRMVDLCLRVLGRCTAPAAGSPAFLAELVWTDRLLRLVIEQGITNPDRATLAGLHPRSPGAEVADHPVHDLEVLARLGAAVSWSPSWRTWRRALAAHDRAVLGIEPDVAAWMDDGMFQRWVVDEVPPLAGLVDDLGLVVPRRVLRDLLDIVRHTP